MAMKQTQTKLFDFSDVGLDFCAGSKNLFPDRFKKMLALGYNEQTVSSVAVAGNQVTFTYGGTHGYVADRVLKVNAPELLSINGGEFVVDSVTENTDTMTIDGAPTSIAGNFTTKIASLGWSLEYENANIHVYKFKALDESDLYLRLCFQDQATRRNCISPCIGKAFDVETGFITDPLSLAETREVVTPHDGFKWEYSYAIGSIYNNYTYTQGFSQFAKGLIIGSIYHFISMHTTSGGANNGRVVGFVPAACYDYAALQYPVMIGESYASMTGTGANFQGTNGRAFVGAVRVVFDQSPLSDNALFAMPQALSSFLAIDTFNTTTAAPIGIYEQSTRQILGMVSGGLYVCKYASTNRPALDSTSPRLSMDIDLNNICPVHYMNVNTSTSIAYLTAPVEEIKVA